MEEILSSIKRIIAEDTEEGISAQAVRERRARPARESSRNKARALEVATVSGEEILELTNEADGSLVPHEALDFGDALPEDEPFEALPLSRVASVQRGQSAKAPAPEASATVSPPTVGGAGIVSVASEVAARASLASLSQMIVKPTSEATDNTLEALVQSMLRPMLKDWLDANLPELVEGMVAKEIARITGRSL